MEPTLRVPLETSIGTENMRPEWFENAVNAAMNKHKKTPSSVAIKEVLAEVPDELKANGEVDSVVVSFHLKSYRKDHKPKSFKRLVKEFMDSLNDGATALFSDEAKEKAQQIQLRLEDGHD